MLILTIDIDWAPDYMLDYVFDQIVDSGAKATIFATHHAEVLRNIIKLFEVGLHPHVRNVDDADRIIGELKNVYPEARALRNHSLLHSSLFYSLYDKYGLKATSNYLMMGRRYECGIQKPYGIVEYPICYMDDVDLALGKGVGDDVLRADHNNTLLVAAFHPVHIYLNTNSLNHYNRVKANIHDKKTIDANRNKGVGIDTKFKQLLARVDLGMSAEHFPR